MKFLAVLIVSSFVAYAPAAYSCDCMEGKAKCECGKECKCEGKDGKTCDHKECSHHKAKGEKKADKKAEMAEPQK